MALDRDETARLFMASLLTRDGYDVVGDAVTAVKAADALREALAAVQPAMVGATTRDAVEAAFPVGSKVRVVRPTSSPSQQERFPVGSIETVCGYDQYDGGWRLLVADNKGWVLPCECVEAVTPAPPSPEPAATETLNESGKRGAYVPPAASPAPYVPKVGDVVVGLFGPDDGKLARVDSTDPLSWSLWCDGAWWSGYGFTVTKDARPATSSERAAAGLPVDESATKPVDREGLARAIREADFATDIIARWPWEGLNAMQREVYFKRADAAIAFMAKGGAS